MYFEDNGQQFRIRFQHDEIFDRDTSFPAGLVPRTTCFIEIKATQSGEPIRLDQKEVPFKWACSVTPGVVRQHYKDKPNRELARKAALGKVGPLPSKRFAAAMWAAYMGRKKARIAE